MKEYKLLENDSPVDFEYPTEALTSEVNQHIESKAVDRSNELNNEFILKLAVRLLSAKDPKLDLIALLYLCKFDVGTIVGASDNSQAAVAQAIGIDKRSFNDKLQRVASSLKRPYHSQKHPRRIRRTCIVVNPVVRLVHECQTAIAAGKMSKEKAQQLFNKALN